MNDPEEFTLLVDMNDPDSLNKTVKFAADDDTRKALAARFGLVSIERFEGQYKITGPRHNGAYVLEGSVEADITQSCVVSLQPVKDHVSEQFDVYLVGEHDMPSDEEEPDVDYEPIIQGKVNVGEVAAQYLSLGINLYPRAADVDLKDISGGKVDISDENVEKERRNPFGILKDLTD